MPGSVALAIFITGIGFLFYLDREKAVRPSKAIWLSVIWLWINGSRPLSVWLGMNTPREVAGQLPASNLLDQTVAAAMMLLGIFILSRRRPSVVAVLKASWPIALYFAFGLISLLWSDFPAWGFKRWIRALGEVAMIMLIVTDPCPVAALKRFLSRAGFVLLPMSILLVKYFPEIGRGYDQWGRQINIGVTTNKNALGVVAFVVGLGTLWQVLNLLIDGKQRNSSRRLLAQGILLLVVVKVLIVAHSATSAACFAFGAGLMLATAFRPVRNRPAFVHVLVLGIFTVGILAMVFDAVSDVVQAMGRESDFTGRTPIWEVLPQMAPNVLGGAGFETFWVGERVLRLDRLFPGINEAHNGYLETYLNLGWIGVGLTALILAHSYLRAVTTLRRYSSVGSLVLAYIITALTYSVTEAGFRMLTPSWMFLLLAAMAASSASLSRPRPAAQRRVIKPKLQREYGAYVDHVHACSGFLDVERGRLA